MKVLMVTFSDNADHQDTLFSMFEMVSARVCATLLAIKNPKAAIERSDRVWLADCPKRPGVCAKTFNLPLLLRLIHRIRKEKFDAIYFESMHIWNLPVMIFAGKAKTYQVLHDVIPHEGDSQEKMVHLMNRMVCALADAIVLRNTKYIAQLSQSYGLPPEKIKYLELWRKYPAYTAPVHSGRILFFGRINPYKGIDNLLAIAKKCPGVQIDVVGKASPQMKSAVEQLSALPNVKLKTGYVSNSEMKAAFVQADWVIVPYSSASQSGVIIDAYKYSRPVVAFDVGAIAEQVENRKSGYLVPAGDPDAFADCLHQALAMPADEYEKMTYYAYEYGSKKYAAGGAIERFLGLFADG